MKIVQIINALTYGGAQNLLLSLSLSLKNNGDSVTVISFKDGPIRYELESAGIQVFILGEAFFDFPGFLSLYKLIKNIKPDLIHSHLFKATILSRIVNCMLKTRVMLVSSIHGRETQLFHYAEKLTNRFSNVLVFPSKYLAEWYSLNISNSSTSRLIVIPPGAVCNKDTELKTKQERISIGVLSRLHPVKGVETILEACKNLKNRGISFKLLIGGDGVLRSKLEQMAIESGLKSHVEFFGKIQNSKQFLDGIDIFVAPSLQEAFGIHVCEAMERNLPVIASNVGGLPEIISNKNNGFLFEAGNSEQLTNVLLELINNTQLRTRIGKLARKTILTKFSRNSALKNYLSVYNNLKKTKAKSIHFVISSNELGGGERLALGLMKSLKQRGWTVTSTCAGKPLSKELEASSIPHSVATIKGEGVFFISKCAKDIRKFKPSIISSHLNKASLYSGILGKLFNIPVISHVHGLNSMFYYKLSSHLIAVSKAVEKYLIDQGIDNNSLSVLPNCIFSNAKRTNRTPNKIISLAIVAKLHKNKGHEWAIKALSKHAKTLPEYKLMIFGDGPEKASLECLCKKLGIKACFMGFVNNMNQYFPEIDIAILPSLGEGIPLSILEAMSHGIPAIATNVGGIPEILKNKYNGILVEPRDDKEFASAIKLLSDPSTYQKYSVNALNHFKLINKYDEMVDKFEEIIVSQINLYET